MDMAGYIGHRGDYHDIFLKWSSPLPLSCTNLTYTNLTPFRVRERNIPILMSSDVTSYTDTTPPTLTLSTGKSLSADLIVAADGIKSLARPLVLSHHDDPISSGYACFRAYFSPSEEMKADPARNAFLSQDSVNFWIGPDTHVVQNTLRGGEEFNWILTHRDDGDIPESWFQPGDMDEVRKLVADIDPDIRYAIMSTERCLDWKICYRKPLSTWVSPKSHRIVLLGDSCHAHLPTSAQGASQATESAGVLAVCLGLVGRDEVEVATRAYEKLRFPRVRVSQTHGEDLRDRWHNVLKNVDDDVDIDPEMVKIKVCVIYVLLSTCLYIASSVLISPQNRPLYAFDAEKDAVEKWDGVASRIRRELMTGQIEPLCDE